MKVWIKGIFFDYLISYCTVIILITQNICDKQKKSFSITRTHACIGMKSTSGKKLRFKPSKKYTVSIRKERLLLGQLLRDFRVTPNSPHGSQIGHISHRTSNERIFSKYCGKLSHECRCFTTTTLQIRLQCIIVNCHWVFLRIFICRRKLKWN